MVGQQIIERAHQRANTVDHVQRLCRLQMGQSRMERYSLGSELFHIS